MSNSDNTEQELRGLAQDLYSRAGDLEIAADILKEEREGKDKDRIRALKEKVKSWLK